MTMEVECESRFTKLEESSKSAHHRIDEIAQTQSEIRALALSVNSLACAVSRMQEGQEDISCRLREIELKPGRRWDQITLAILISVATLAVGYLVGKGI